jgi:hypothetical protein
LIEYTPPCAGFELTTLVVIGTDCIGSGKSNYHTIPTTTAAMMYKDLIFEKRKYNTVGTVAKPSRKMGKMESKSILPHVTHICDRSLTGLRTCTSIKSSGVKPICDWIL